MMKIRKRNGSEVTFNKQNIVEAISRANEKVRLDERLTIQEIKDIAKNIEDDCKVSPVAIGYKDIQKMVETSIMKAGKYEVATEYITFRYQKALDERILLMIEFYPFSAVITKIFSKKMLIKIQIS